MDFPEFWALECVFEKCEESSCNSKAPERYLIFVNTLFEIFNSV